LSLISRGVEIVLSLGLYWSALVYDFLVGRDEEVVPFRARQLRNLLCDLGPSFIKAGQVCYCSVLSSICFVFTS
jgi:predicted unusual protein kinase regulating ubiquinone biosynthesis (AarF/ABC1/UbiB family)